MARIDAIFKLGGEEKVDPPPEDHRMRGQCLFELGRPEDAAKEIEIFLKNTDREFDPAVRKAYELLNQCKKEKQGTTA